jgi:ribonuclease P protein component
VENRRATISCLSGVREFSEVRKSPIKWRIHPWLLLHFLPLTQDKEKCEWNSKLGFAIRGTYLNAVKRNRLKRVIRSALQDAIRELQNQVWVVVWVSRRVTKDEWLQHERWFKQNRSFVVEKLRKFSQNRN